MNRQQIFERISYYLAHLRVLVEQANKLNLQDINLHSEIFFRDLLNLILGYDLKNMNLTEANVQAIDLIDEKNRIAIQITSTSAIAKIKHTVDGFIEKKFFANCDELVVIIIGKKEKYRTKTLGDEGSFIFNVSENVWDLNDVLARINNLEIGTLAECHDFIRTNLRMSDPHQPNEVRTLIRLVEVLSSVDEGVSIGHNREDPDPEGKIGDRFAEYSDFITKQYVKLHEIYGKILGEIKNHTDLGHVRVLKLQVYLMNWSDRVLLQKNYNPKNALDELVSQVLQMMGGREASFDEGAIRYYLIEQLIHCNVFPNKNAKDV